MLALAAALVPPPSPRCGSAMPNCRPTVPKSPSPTKALSTPSRPPEEKPQGLPPETSTPILSRSPDGKSIAFASDRNGGSDIFIMKADGATPTRLTFNSTAETPQAFSADGKSIIFSAALQDPASSVLAPMRVNSELYTVPVFGGHISQLLPTPADNIEIVPGGDLMLYEDVKGNEDKWRKHHTSSITRDIRSWSPSKKQFKNLTDRPGEDREPNPSPDGRGNLLPQRTRRRLHECIFHAHRRWLGKGPDEFHTIP